MSEDVMIPTEAEQVYAGAPPGAGRAAKGARKPPERTRRLTLYLTTEELEIMDMAAEVRRMTAAKFAAHYALLQARNLLIEQEKRQAEYERTIQQRHLGHK